MSSFFEISSIAGILFGYDLFETSPPLVKVVMDGCTWELIGGIVVDVGGVLQFSSSRWSCLARRTSRCSR